MSLAAFFRLQSNALFIDSSVLAFATNNNSYSQFHYEAFSNLMDFKVSFDDDYKAALEKFSLFLLKTKRIYRRSKYKSLIDLTL